MPLLARRALLSDPRTRAASEMTVFSTAAAWLARRGGATAEARAALAACLRAPQLPARYISSVAAAAPWFTDSLPAGDLHAAALFAGPPSLSRYMDRPPAALEAEEAEAYRSALAAAHPAFARHTAWRLPPRPASRLDADCMAFGWGLDLEDLESMFHAVRQSGAPACVESRDYFFAGLTWRMRLVAAAGERGRGRADVYFALEYRAEPPAGHAGLWGGDDGGERADGAGSDVGAVPVVVSAVVDVMALVTEVERTADDSDAMGHSNGAERGPERSSGRGGDGTSSEADAAAAPSEPAGAAAARPRGDLIVAPLRRKGRYVPQGAQGAGACSSFPTGEWRPRHVAELFGPPEGGAAAPCADWDAMLERLHEGEYVAPDGEVKVALKIWNVW